MFQRITEISGSLLAGGLTALRDKLNEVIRVVNSTQQIRGDETFIGVQHSPGIGVTIGLNINQVLARIPKQWQGEAYFPCKVTVDGGIAGSMAASQTCSFTYSLFDLNGNALTDSSGTAITGRTPDAPRFTNCQYGSPPAMSMGVAYRDANGTTQLLWAVKEKPTGKILTAFTTLHIDGSGNFAGKTTPALVLDVGTESADSILIDACP